MTNFDSMIDEELDSDQVSKQQIASEDELPGTNNQTKEEQTVYVIEFETEPDEKDEESRKRGKDGRVGMSILSPLPYTLFKDVLHPPSDP